MKLLTTIAVATAALGMAATAQAGVTASGHVGFQITDYDNDLPAYTGSDDDLFFGPMVFSQSRFRFNASKKVGANKWGLQQEFGLGANGSSPIVRRNNFYVSGGFGKVSLGMGNDVGDGAINADLAGTNIVRALSSNDTLLRSSSEASSTIAGRVGAAGFDPARSEALRYYSPKLGGVAKVAVQLQENGGNEIVVKVDSNGFRFNAFVEDTGASTGVTGHNGFLVGYKNSGFSITAVASTEENSASAAEIDHSGFKVGYAMGKHKFSISSTERDPAGANNNTESTGIEYLNNVAKGVQLYVGYGSEETEGSTVEPSGIALGGRVKF